MTKYRICTKCPVHHYENCMSCFGYGVYKISDDPGKAYPVHADTANTTHEYSGEVLACPECGSTELGYPRV